MWQDLAIGFSYSLLSLIFILLYVPIIWTILSESDLRILSAYKFMLLLALFDILQLIAHLFTGLITLTCDDFEVFTKYLGAVATPSYIGYVTTTFVLAILRLVQITVHTHESLMFGKVATKIWIGLILLINLIFTGFLASPEATINYSKIEYSWKYDLSLQHSHFIQKVEMYMELILVVVSCVIYIMITIFLWKLSQSMGRSTSESTETRILIHTGLVTVYCTILNGLWHNTEFINPQGDMCVKVLLNYMWICNAGVNPILLLMLNKTIRNRFRTKIQPSRHAALNIRRTTITPLYNTGTQKGFCL